MHKRARLGVTILVVSLLMATSALAQTAIIRRNSNLRADPSMAHEPIRLLLPPEQVDVPGPVYQNGYYKVKTAQGEEGWAWGRNLRITSGASATGGDTAGKPAATSGQLLQAANLRPEPGSHEPAIGVIEAGTTVEITDPVSRRGYYQVKTADGRQGWVWGQNLAIGAAGAAAAAAPAAAVAPAVPAAPAAVAVPPTAVPTPERPKPSATSIPATATAKPAAPTSTPDEEDTPAATATAVPPTATAVPPTATPEERAPAPAADAGGALKAGQMLDQSNAAMAKDLLPPEILQHYERGEYVSKIVDYPLGNPNWEKAFVEASKENAERLTVDERGTVIDKATGKHPEYLYGLPFPNIDPKDPSAGVKVIWNYYLATWYGGSSHTRTRLIMLNNKGVERELGAEGWFEFFDGQASKYRKDNPMNLQSQFLAVALSPADTQGTAALSWRFRDADTRDSQWAFVPALRRVRAVSPANRSDGYLGSDISSDDGYLFDGKPQDFDFKLIGKRDALRVVDPESLPVNTLKPKPGRDGGWESLTERKGYYGYEIAGWTGLPWALPQGGLAKRPVWIVEATPKDKYYLYGKLVLWIDAENYAGAYHQKFSWGGEHVLTYAVLGLPNQTTPDGTETTPLTTQTWAVAENFKMKRASLAGARYDAKSPFDRHVKIDPGIFDAGALMRYGK